MKMEEERWALYDSSEFPYVKVDLGETIKSDEDFKHYTDSWLRLYENERPFMLYFDATKVGFVNIKYAFKMANFIRDLKRRKDDGNIEFLQCSVIKVNSWYVRFLLKLIFFLQSPVAPVHITTDQSFNFNEKSTQQDFMM